MKSFVHFNLLIFLMLCAFFSASAQIQIPNGSFENWDGMNPQGWETNNGVNVPPYPTVVALKDTISPYEGQNDLLLIYNWTYPAWAKTAFDNTGHPSSLSAYVKCIVHGADTVDILVEILSNGDVVNSGYWSVSDTTIEEWTKIMIPITQSDIEVFETRILIKGGRVSGPADEASTLWVDSLSLGYGPLGLSEGLLAQNDLIISPNPTDGVIHILKNSPLKLISTTVYSQKGTELLKSNDSTLDLSDLPIGNYYLKIQTNHGVLTRKVVRVAGL